MDDSIPMWVRAVQSLGDQAVRYALLIRDRSSGSEPPRAKRKGIISVA